MKRRGGSPAASKGPRKDRKVEELAWAAAPEDDEEIDSDSDADAGSDDDGGAGGSDDDVVESADQQRLRLAKEYIRRVRGDVRGDAADGAGVADAEEDAAVAGRLQEDVLAARGDLQTAVASQLVGATLSDADVVYRRGHQVCARV
jgi:ribosomal RNA-processing protein 9